MAQAFSSFDTYLAAYVKNENLSYKEVKQCIQSFIYGINTPSRWGCVPYTTQVLTPDGWKGPDDLKVGDIIFTWVSGVMKEAPLKHIIRHENNYDVLHQYTGNGYVQTVTPEHRCLVELGTGRGVYGIEQSMNIFQKTAELRMPTLITDVMVSCDNQLSDEEVVSAAVHYAMGIAGFDDAIDDKFLHLSKEQSGLFINTLMLFGGDMDQAACRYDNENIAEALEIIMLRSGHTSHRGSYRTTYGSQINYVYMDTERSAVIAERKEIPYSGMVWCPNTDDGTAIFRDKDGNIFISGNCQAPFSNVTLDWVCPSDMKNLPALVGNKEMDFTYGDCQREMDMVNKAFIEIMIEGDANGRGFQYPMDCVA